MAKKKRPRGKRSAKKAKARQQAHRPTRKDRQVRKPGRWLQRMGAALSGLKHFAAGVATGLGQAAGRAIGRLLGL